METDTNIQTKNTLNESNSNTYEDCPENIKNLDTDEKNDCDTKKVKKNNANSDESDDDNKLEKNSLEKSFDLSTDEEDEEYDAKEDVNNIENEEANYIENIVDKPQPISFTNDQESKTALNGNKSEGEATSSKKTSTTGNDAKSKAEAQKKKNQGTDNSAKELVRKRKLEQMEEENKRMQVLMANFSEEQLNRYEIYRRSAFQKSTVKKIVQTVSSKTVSASVVIAMSGIAKVFVGEIVEKALDIKTNWGDTGPLQPKHLREAFRVMKNESKIATSLRTKHNAIFS